MNELASVVSEVINSKKSVDEVKGVLTTMHETGSWIKITFRINALGKLSIDILKQVLDFNYMMNAANIVLQKVALNEKETINCPRVVLWGHKNQGKSQLLHFLFVLFQSLDELVVYLDKSVMPLDESGEVADVTNILKWKETFSSKVSEIQYSLMNEEVNEKICEDCIQNVDIFSKSGKKQDFIEMIKSVRIFAKLEHNNNNNKVWVIVDEVTAWKQNKLGYFLPNDQDESPFHFIVTGSAEMGTWTSEQHLRDDVVDMPFLDLNSGWNFAFILAEKLGYNLENKLEEQGVIIDGGPEFLEQQFGGVPGYIAEFVFEIKNDVPMFTFFIKLEERIFSVMNKGARVSKQDLATNTLIEINKPNNPWDGIRNLGLCGKFPPRGQIAVMILRWLDQYAPNDKERTLQAIAKLKTSVDKGLQGCLLELELLTKLEIGKTDIILKHVSLNNNLWVLTPKIIDIDLSKLTDLSVLTYNGTAVETEQLKSRKWVMVKVPSCFPVLDVLMVEITKNGIQFFILQITRSEDPFTTHDTHKTCHPKSTVRLNAFIQAVCEKLNIRDPIPDLQYVLIAPFCNINSYAPPLGHVDPIWVQIPNLKENGLKMKMERGCCRCTLGNCKKCYCVRKQVKCKNTCQSEQCNNK
jgi:hypothetical protein